MASEFVEAAINELPVGHQRALERVALRRDFREAIDPELDLDGLLADMRERSLKGDFEPLLRAIVFEPGTVISAADHQQMLVEAYVDLLGIYQQNNHVDHFLSRFYEVINSTQTDIKKSLLRLNEIVLTLLAKRQNPTFNEVKLLSFQQSVNSYQGLNKAVVDPETGLLGPQRVVLRKFAQRKGPLSPRVTTEVLTAGLPGNAIRTFTPENAVNPDPRRFWADVILSEILITSTYEGTDYNGPITEFKIRLPQAEIINQVRVQGFTRFPMKLIGLKYRIGNQVWDVPGFSGPVLIEDDLVEVNFEAIKANDIRLVLAQEGWRELHVHIPRDKFRTQELLDLLFQRVTDTVVSRDQVDFSRVNEAIRLLDETTEKLDTSDLGRATREVFFRITEDEDIVRKASLIVGDTTEGGTRRDAFVELQRYEYLFGLRQVEVNRVQYAPESVYASELLKPAGSPFIFALDTIEDITETTVPANQLNREFEVQYDIELSNRRSFPILPEDTTRVIAERLIFDQTTRVAKTRFAAATTNATLYRNGIEIPDGDFTVGGGTDNRETLIVSSYNKFTPNATWTLSYDLLDTFTTVDVTNIFDSIKATKPEVYPGTDENNFVDLGGVPFILLDIIHDTDKWFKRNPRDARYEYVPRQGDAVYNPLNVDHDPPVVELDGEFYGAFNALNTVIIYDTTTTIVFDRDIPPSGIIRIDEELMSYTRDPVTFTTGIMTRGILGTKAADHPASSNSTWVALRFYEPITVLVNGTRASNLTDYAESQHNAFQPSEVSNDIHSYVQIGRRLYFDSEVRGNIGVFYRRMADYIRLRATFIQHSTRERFYGGKVSSAIIKTRAAVT